MGAKSAEIFGEPNSSPHGVGAEQLPVSVTTSFSLELLNEATIDPVLQAAIEQLEDYTTNRLLIAVLKEYEDSGTTQKDDTSLNATVNSK